MARAAGWAWAGLVLACAAVASASEPASGLADARLQVEVDLRVRGELFATSAAAAEPARRPIALDARFEFVELASPAAASGPVTRRYAVARATIETEGHRAEQRLAADARDVLVRLEGTTPLAYLSAGYLSRDEAELLDVPFDPILVDGLRPDRPMAQGDSWKLPGDLVAGLLAIDTVESGGVEATLSGVNDGTALMKLQGTVVGAVDGVPTRIELNGAATAAATPQDQAQWRVDGKVATVEAVIAERREAGWVAPGLDVEATISIKRSPGPAMAESAAGAGPEFTARPDGLAPPAADRPAGEGRAGVIWHRHRQGRYIAVLDGRWRVVEDGPEGLVLRLNDRGRLVAQCSVLPLPRVAADAAPAEETVCDDVRRSLADQFGRIVASEAAVREDGTRVVRVVAEGAADGRPFRWIHYVLTDAAGHQLAATFMHEPALGDRFAAADRELVGGLAMPPEPPGRQAALPAGGPR